LTDKAGETQCVRPLAANTKVETPASSV